MYKLQNYPMMSGAAKIVPTFRHHCIVLQFIYSCIYICIHIYVLAYLYHQFIDVGHNHENTALNVYIFYKCIIRTLRYACIFINMYVWFYLWFNNKYDHTLLHRCSYCNITLLKWEIKFQLSKLFEDFKL